MTSLQLPGSINIIVGHFGSGKTNISVNLALDAKKSGCGVTLIDLDVVNPYFRAADSAEALAANGIKTIVPPYANTNVDIPVLPSDILRIFNKSPDAKNKNVFDVGGDNGAVALGQYFAYFSKTEYSMVCVINMYRPLTREPDGVLMSIAEIEECSRLKCTHLINNSNLGAETTSETVESSLQYADECSALCGLPVAVTAVADRNIYAGLAGKYPNRDFWLIKECTRKLF